jgi:hypothetical protein
MIYYYIIYPFEDKACVVCMYVCNFHYRTIYISYRIHNTSLTGAYFGLDIRECLENSILYLVDDFCRSYFL